MNIEERLEFERLEVKDKNRYLTYYLIYINKNKLNLLLKG